MGKFQPDSTPVDVQYNSKVEQEVVTATLKYVKSKWTSRGESILSPWIVTKILKTNEFIWEEYKKQYEKRYGKPPKTSGRSRRRSSLGRRSSLDRRSSGKRYSFGRRTSGKRSRRRSSLKRSDSLKWSEG